MGNHEDVIIKLWDSQMKNTEKHPVRKADKARTLASLTQEHIDWMKALPKLHVMDDLNLVSVHGGLWPGLPLYAQPHNVIRAQLIQPYMPEGETRWWGHEAAKHKCGKTEEQSYAEGYRRWYEVYDGKENVIFGHSVFVQPYFHKNKDHGYTLGIDTGSCFGGVLTAVIIDGISNPYFISVKPKRVYCEDKLQQFIPR